MFDIAKLKLYLIIGVIGAVIIGGFYWSYTSRGKEIKEQAATIVKQDVTIAVQKEDAVVTGKSTAVTEEVKLKTDDEIKTVIKQVKKNSNKTADAVQTIRNDPVYQNPTPEKAVERDTKISEVYINELWDNYALAVAPNKL